MKYFLKVVIVNIAIVSGILVTFEIALRLFGLAPTTIARAVYYSNLIGDYEPSISITDKRVKQYPFTFSTNSQGVRSKQEISAGKDVNTFRILCIGDSFTMGWGVNDEYTYPELLRKFLQEKYKNINIEVVSAGDIFSNILDQTDYYLDKGRKLKPDLVILQFYPNDIFNEMARGRVDRIEKKNAAIQYENTIVHRMKIFVSNTAMFNFIGKMIVNIVGVGRIVEARATAPRNKDELFLESLLVHEGYNISTASNWNELLKEKNIEVNKKLWDNYISALSSIQEKLNLDGVGLALIAIPSALQLTNYMNSPSCCFSEYSNTHGLKFIDYSSVFRKFALNGADNEIFFLKGDGHTNTIGNTLIATTLAKDISLYELDGRLMFDVNDNGGIKRNCSTKKQISIFASGKEIRFSSDTSSVMVSAVRQKNLTIPSSNRAFIESDTPDGNRGSLKIDFHSEQNVSLLDMILKYSIFNDILKENNLSVSLSSDGGDYRFLNIFASDGTGSWTSSDGIKILESKINPPAHDFSILIQFNGKAGIVLSDDCSSNNALIINLYE